MKLGYVDTLNTQNEVPPPTWHRAMCMVASLCVCLGFARVVNVAFATPTKCAKGYKTKTHTVAKGEVVSRVAHAYGLGAEAILDSNPDLDPNRLSEGQKLRLCIPKKKRLRRCRGGGKRHEHNVARGDTLASIAERYGVGRDAILKENPALANNPDNLQAGQTIEVCANAARLKSSKACGFRTPLHRHEVVPGEWLAEIASRYGVRKRKLLALNPALRKNPDYLRPGQMLRVCPDIAPRSRERLRHTVTRGQTMVSIAQHYDLHPQQLIKFQQGRLKNPDTLRVGQRLWVWKDGGIVPGFSDGSDESGSLPGGIQLPTGRHYVMKNKRLAWGTGRTIRLIQEAVSDYHNRSKGPAVRIGDISRKGGGRFPPHKSHRTGEDVDVGYALRGAAGKVGKRFKPATAASFNARASWRLIKAFLDTDHIRYLFVDYRLQRGLYEEAKRRGASQGLLDELFQYPRGKRRAYGIIRHEPGHVDHFHVRFD